MKTVKTREFEINGVIQTDIEMTEEEFQDLFIEWIENNNMIFGGHVNINEE